MSQSLDFAGFEPVCGCQGCHEPARSIIDHPAYGRRAVCERHSRHYEVTADV